MMTYTNVILLFALATHVRPVISSPSPLPFMVLSGGKTCGDEMQLYEDSKCLGASPSKLTTTTVVPYVAAYKTAFVSPGPQEVSCRLPVFCHGQFPVDKDAYMAAYENEHNGLKTFGLLDIWSLNGFAFHHGQKLFSGSSFSEYALDGSKFDPTNASSVPRNLYAHEYFVDSEATYTFWKWYASNFGHHFLAKGGVPNAGARALLLGAADSTTRLVFSGMCKSYVDLLKQAFDEMELTERYGTTLDFSLPGASMMARPSVPVESSVRTVDFSSRASIDAIGLQPTGWMPPDDVRLPVGSGRE